MVAFVDPDMMETMPKNLTAATGMDALTHAIEGYITLNELYPVQRSRIPCRQHIDREPYPVCPSQDVGIPADLKDIVKPEDIPFLAQSAYDDACRPGNPRHITGNIKI